MTETNKPNPRVTTKRGDAGTTDLFGGTRVEKSSPLIELIGICDEVQSVLALVKVNLVVIEQQIFITTQQKQLYQFMGELSHGPALSEEAVADWVTALEEEQKKLMAASAISNKFVIPGANPAEAWCHFARTSVRTLERRLCEQALIEPHLVKYIPYINRMSDFFFVLAQTLA